MSPVPHETGLFNAPRLSDLCVLSLVAGFSLIVLFTNLGVYPLWGSEGRWAVIGRYMFQSGDIFNPMLGNSAYRDKPLVSYWQILPFAYALGGVSELTARLPSSLWASVMLILTYHLARRWFGRGSALLSAAVLSTSCGFIFWGRNAQVEMTNAAMTMLVLWYFLTRRQNHGQSRLSVLALLMGIGANMKGLTAVGAPIFCILLLSAFTRDWKWLPGPRAAIQAGLVFTAAVLLIPLINCMSSSSCDPLRLIWKENVIRYFDPFDHRGAFYLYFYRIFDLAAPWSALLPLCLFTCFRHGRCRENGIMKALLISSGIFLFFTLSGSRRSYYLLPILPFTSILIGDFICRFVRGHLPLKTGLAVKLTGFLMGAALLFPLAVFIFGTPMMPQGIEVLFPWSIVLAACGVIMMMGFSRRHVPGMIAPVALVWLVFVFAVIPWASSRPGNIRSETAKVNALKRPVGFLISDDAKTIFYLKRPYAVLPDIHEARIWAERTGGVLIAYDHVTDLSWQTVTDEGNWKALVLRKPSEYSKQSPHPQPIPAT